MPAKPQVLLIHPDVSIRDEIAHCLIEAGCHVCQAAGRKDGLHLLYAVHPDLILIAVGPEASSSEEDVSSCEAMWETVARIRLFTDTPVIALLAQLTPADRERGLALQGVEVLEGVGLPEQVRAPVMAQLALSQVSNVRRARHSIVNRVAPLCTSQFLNLAQLSQLDRTLDEVGEWGEVRLIKARGRLCFITRIKVERYEPIST